MDGVLNYLIQIGIFFISQPVEWGNSTNQLSGMSWDFSTSHLADESCHLSEGWFVVTFQGADFDWKFETLLHCHLGVLLRASDCNVRRTAVRFNKEWCFKSKNHPGIESLWLDFELSNTLLSFSILKISYLSPIPKGPFWFLQTQVPPLFGFAGFLIGSLYWLPGSWCVSSQFSRETNSNTPKDWWFLANPQVPKTTAGSLSRRWTTGTVMVFYQVEDQLTEGLKLLESQRWFVWFLFG